MPKRTNLPSCCEEWILQWGHCYENGEHFRCMPHRHQWQKEESLFIQRDTSIEWQIQQIGDHGYTQLMPLNAPLPLTNRCCAAILIAHGPKTKKPVVNFICPNCKIHWILTEEDHPVRREVYTNKNTQQRFTWNPGSTIPFLEPISTEYLPLR